MARSSKVERAQEKEEIRLKTQGKSDAVDGVVAMCLDTHNHAHPAFYCRNYTSFVEWDSYPEKYRGWEIYHLKTDPKRRKNIQERWEDEKAHIKKIGMSEHVRPLSEAENRGSQKKRTKAYKSVMRLL